MVDIVSKKCARRRCSKQPHFGVSGTKKRGFCSRHAHRTGLSTSPARSATTRVAPRSHRLAWRGARRQSSARNMPKTGCDSSCTPRSAHAWAAARERRLVQQEPRNRSSTAWMPLKAWSTTPTGGAHTTASPRLCHLARGGVQQSTVDPAYCT